MAAITTPSRYQGATAVTKAYASTSTLVCSAPEGNDLHVCYATLTGAMTINVTCPGLLQFQKVFFHFCPDGTGRVVTFGTGFVSSGTLTTVASVDSTVMAIFDGTNLKIVAREIGA